MVHPRTTAGGDAVLRTFRTRDSDVILSSLTIRAARLRSQQQGSSRKSDLDIKSQVLVIEHPSQEPRDLSDIINDILRLFSCKWTPFRKPLMTASI